MKNFLRTVYRRMHLYKLYNHLPFNNKYKLNGAKIKNFGKTLKKCRFICHGEGNTIILHPHGIIKNTVFRIYGNNNTVEICNGSAISQGELYIEDDGNRIEIGENTLLTGKIHLACIESKTIKIGNDCLLSSEIVFRTGDSHSILDMSGNRINPAEDVIIDDHVWIGHRAVINKGAYVAPNTVIGAGTIVTKKFSEANVILAGVPARIVKKDINWDSKRL